MASIIPLTPTTLLLLSLICFLVLVPPPSLADNYLSSGHTLSSGQSLTQDSYQFILRHDCYLVLEDGGIPIWHADYIIVGGRDCYLSLESDGKLVVYASNNRPIWSTPSQGRNGFYQLLMQKDRNVVIYGPERWATGTQIVPQYGADGEKNSTGRAGAVSAAGLKIPPPFITDNHLLSGFSVSAGESLTQGSYIFTMQYDCNLVLYDSGTPIWATNTGGQASGCYLTLESDGKLVVYAQDSKVVWATKPAGPAGHNYLLLVQKDRNVVVYGPSGWNTETNYVPPSTYAALVGAKNDSTTAAAAAVISQVVAG